MKRMALLLALTLSLPLAAQNRANDVGLWLVAAQVDDTESRDGQPFSVGFDEEHGYGLSFTHFWTDSFSTELSATRFQADVEADFFGFEGEAFHDEGTLEATILSGVAQWHVNRDGLLSPYFGAGVARLSGDYESRTAAGFPFALEAAAGAVVNAGLNAMIGERIALSGDVKYTKWNIGAGRDVRIDPLLFSAGVRLRF